MNILDVLNKNKDIYSFEYFGIDDMATSFEVNLLIERENEIISYFNKKENNLQNYDDFIDYLFAKKNTQMNELIPYIKIEVKEKFEKIIEVLTNYLKRVKIGQLLNYINNNIDFLLSERNRYLSEQIFEIAFKYYSGCHTAILKLIDERFYLILDNFKDISSILNSNEEYTNRILDTKKFEEIKTYRLKEYLTMIEWYKNSFSEVDGLINIVIAEIINYANQIYDIITEDNIIQYDHIIKDIYEFLVSIKHKEANMLEEKNKTLEILMEKYLKKHGKSFSYEIPMEKLLKPFENENIHPQAKILMLTHTKKKDSEELESVYARVGRDNEKHFADMCSTSSQHDDYFTLTKQQILNINDNVYLHLLQYYVCDDRIKEFISMIAALLTEVCKHYSIEYEELEFDFNILLNSYINLFTAYKNNNDYLIIGLNYGLVMFQCGIIEKLLRSLYKSQKNDTYIKTDWCSLGNILNPKDEVMLNFFDENDIKIFRYYLVDGGNGKVGLNYRNNFAHYKNMKSTDMDYGKTLKIMHILLTIINDLVLTIK